MHVRLLEIVHCIHCLNWPAEWCPSTAASPPVTQRPGRLALRSAGPSGAGHWDDAWTNEEQVLPPCPEEGEGDTLIMHGELASFNKVCDLG